MAFSRCMVMVKGRSGNRIDAPQPIFRRARKAAAWNLSSTKESTHCDPNPLSKGVNMGNRQFLLKTLAVAASAGLAITACNKEKSESSANSGDNQSSTTQGTGYGSPGTGTGGAGDDTLGAGSGSLGASGSDTCLPWGRAAMIRPGRAWAAPEAIPPCIPRSPSIRRVRVPRPPTPWAPEPLPEPGQVAPRVRGVADPVAPEATLSTIPAPAAAWEPADPAAAVPVRAVPAAAGRGAVQVLVAPARAAQAPGAPVPAAQCEPPPASGSIRNDKVMKGRASGSARSLHVSFDVYSIYTVADMTSRMGTNAMRTEWMPGLFP